MKPHEVDPFSWAEFKKAIPAGIIAVAGFFGLVYGFCCLMAAIGMIVR